MSTSDEFSDAFNEWQIAEVLAQPEELFVLWALDTALCSSIEDFHHHFGADEEIDALIDQLDQRRFLQRQGALLQLTDGGREVLARFERSLTEQTPEALRRAAAAYQSTLAAFPTEEPELRAIRLYNLGVSLLQLAQFEHKQEQERLLSDALHAFKTAQTAISAEADPNHWQLVQERLHQTMKMLETFQRERQTRAEAPRSLVPGDMMRIDDKLVKIEAVTSQDQHGANLIVSSSSGLLERVFVPADRLASVVVARNTGKGDPNRALACLWGKWMEYASPKIRSAALAVRPVKPYPHQDEAVFAHMLPQPQLRFLLADEPGTGKTIMTGLYLTEGRRRGLIPGKVIIVVPAHLVAKWLRDLYRFFQIAAMRVTPEMGRQPQPLRPDIDVWVVSLDLYTYNQDVRRKIAGLHASWSLAVIDEAHRLTPTSQYLDAGRQVAQAAHHLLLLTATPHRGNEHFFRALLNVLDTRLFPWEARQQDYDSRPLQPSTLHFLRRMKEQMRDLDGNRLFPQRFADTHSVKLSDIESDAYTAVMDYVDRWYPAHSSLAKSVYGRRAASSIHAAYETMSRRRSALSNGRSDRSDRRDTFTLEESAITGTALEDDEVWAQAEEEVIAARSTNRREELTAADSVLTQLRSVRDLPISTAKWSAVQEILAVHNITTLNRTNQLLMFTEFTDTAHWLQERFLNAGYSCEVLEGASDTDTRDRLQQRFLSGGFQVLVSTDAGGEGIDLQSAHVMINWDIPWSLVRLEQRMGRLHRIGQRSDVYIYHLVAPATREGQVQEVLLKNLDVASRRLKGRIFDLLDATASQLGFNYTQALTQAQQSSAAGSAASALVPRVDTLVATARDLAAEEDRFSIPPDLNDARERFAADRLEAINPVIVEGFLQRLATIEAWQIRTGSARGILLISSSSSNLPEALGGKRVATVSADGAAVRRAWEDGVDVSRVILLGPTEEPFDALVKLASHANEEHLMCGAAADDPTSLSDYTVFVWTCDLTSHDGVKPETRPVPLLVRYSGTEAFPMDWEAILKLIPATRDASVPPPATRFVTEEAARQAMTAEEQRIMKEKTSWVEKARVDMDNFEARYRRQIASYPENVRPQLREEFALRKANRLDQLDQISNVSATNLRMLGWLQVRGTAQVGQLGWDPDSEKVAIAVVMTELSADYLVDDRQSAGVGYDLSARHKRTGEVRLVEVKGLEGNLAAVTFEQHEWAQAQQRGDDYWLYIVAHCAQDPKVVIRVQNPARVFLQGEHQITRFRIPVTKLRSVMETQ